MSKAYYRSFDMVFGNQPPGIALVSQASLVARKRQQATGDPDLTDALGWGIWAGNKRCSTHSYTGGPAEVFILRTEACFVAGNCFSSQPKFFGEKPQNQWG